MERQSRLEQMPAFRGCTWCESSSLAASASCRSLRSPGPLHTGWTQQRGGVLDQCRIFSAGKRKVVTGSRSCVLLRAAELVAAALSRAASAMALTDLCSSVCHPGQAGSSRGPTKGLFSPQLTTQGTFAGFMVSPQNGAPSLLLTKLQEVLHGWAAKLTPVLSSRSSA